MTIKVLHDFICIKEPTHATQTSFGLVLLADKEATFACPVVGVGPGTVDERGNELTTGGIQAGDVVHLPKEVISGATKTKIDGETFLFIKPPQVLAWERP
ncbi:10 kDa chaperonin [compost metagenome]